MTAEQPLEATPRRPGIGLFLILIAVVFAAYAIVLDAFFVADDFNVLHIVSTATNTHEATGIAAGWLFFRPLTAMTFWWTWLAFGFEPIAFHAFDVFLHACNAWLVGLLAFRLCPARFVAPIAALCFALLPTSAECVTWIAGRFDVLCVTGSLLCITGTLEYRRRGGAWPLAWACFGFLVGLLAKDTGIILIAFIPLLLATPGLGAGFRPWRATLPGLLALVTLFAVYLTVRIQVLGGFGGYPSGAPGGGSSHLQVDLDNAVRFVTDAIAYITAPGTGAVHAWITLALLGIAAGITLRSSNRPSLAGRGPLLAGCFFLGLLPAANTVAIMPHGEGTRFLYLPSIFFCAFTGILLGAGLARCDARALRTGLGVVVLLLASYAVTLTQINRHWRTAGAQAETILDQIGAVLQERSYKYLFIHDLPDRHHEAFVFRNGFERAISLFVDEAIEVPEHWRVSRADWDKFSARRRQNPDEYPDFLLLRWLPTENRLVEP